MVVVEEEEVMPILTPILHQAVVLDHLVVLDVLQDLAVDMLVVLHLHRMMDLLVAAEAVLKEVKEVVVEVPVDIERMSPPQSVLETILPLIHFQ